MMNTSEAESAGLNMVFSKPLSDSSAKVVSGVRQVKVSEQEIIARIEKLERKYARRIQRKESDAFSSVKTLFRKKNSNQSDNKSAETSSKATFTTIDGNAAKDKLQKEAAVDAKEGSKQYIEILPSEKSEDQPEIKSCQEPETSSCQEPETAKNQELEIVANKETAISCDQEPTIVICQEVVVEEDLEPSIATYQKPEMGEVFQPAIAKWQEQTMEDDMEPDPEYGIILDQEPQKNTESIAVNDENAGMPSGFGYDSEMDMDNFNLAFMPPSNIKNETITAAMKHSDERFPDEDENSFRRMRLSRTQRQTIKAMREEEEDKPMIFFEKNSGFPSQEGKDTTSKDSSLESQENEDGEYDESESLDENGNPVEFSEDSAHVPAAIKRDMILREIFDWVKHIAIAVVIGLLLVMFVIQRNVVIGSSMEPNMYEKDQLIVQKVTKLIPNGIAHGDIITINAEGFLGHSGDKNIIKRVIGVPGDTVDINEDGVYRNGEKLAEPYLDGVKTMEREASYSHVTLAPNQFYVLGDNRNVSLDSRMFGPIDKSRIIGEVLIRFYPLNKFGTP